MSSTNRRYKPRRNKAKARRQRNLLVYGTVIIAAIIFFASDGPGSILGRQSNNQTNLNTPTTFDTPWWDASYSFRKEIRLGQTQSGTAQLDLDHRTLVKNNQSLGSGVDLRVIKLVDEKLSTVPLKIVNPNQLRTSIIFDISNINVENSSYYLYFGNRQASQQVEAEDLTEVEQGEFIIKAGITETPAVSISRKKYWALIMPNGIDMDIELQIDPVIITENIAPEIYVVGKQTPYVASYKTDRLNINIPSLKPGEYEIYTRFTSEGENYRSNNIQVKVSYPVYVAWTIDWEGRDVKDWVLEAIDTLAQKYNMPLTHFFNPRIYVAEDIPEYRSAELTNWVKARNILHNDEIALHMHMYYDMVAAAGVEPLRLPNWGSGFDGYDVLTSGYNYAEFSKILRWALDQFEEHNLPKPRGYRAGGWFANLDTIKALNDEGLAYDSSGREKYKFGSQKKQGAWDLEPTTQPYQPSTENINLEVPAPNFNLWEIPNNGNDSYWFDLKTLISRFYVNYPGEGVVESPTIITYLSHPDWYDVDQPKMTALLKEINKHSYQNNRGPVVYSTLGEALKSWDN